MAAPNGATESPGMIDTRYLMGVLRQLADAGHVDAVPKLITAWGGTRRLIPVAPSAGHELVAIVGLPAARVLADLRGGQEVDIPRGVGLGVKKAAILRATGSAREIARQAECTERHVRKIRNGGPRDPDQGSLL